MKVARALNFRKVDKLLKLPSSTKKGVHVGVLSSAKHSGRDVTIAQVALLNEYGHGSTPARPFMRDSFRNNANHIAVIKQLTREVLSGERTLNEVLDILGSHSVDKLKQTIEDYSSPANASSTVTRKGFNDPLVDTGLLLESIQYEKT